MSYFSDEELSCKCGCGQLVFDPAVRSYLNSIREELGFAMPVTSGYRCELHPIEACKERPGAHTTGKAVDIGVSRDQAHKVLQAAIKHGCPRIGVNQKGAGRFIHLDWDTDRPHPTVWSY